MLENVFSSTTTQVRVKMTNLQYSSMELTGKCSSEMVQYEGVITGQKHVR